RADSMSKTADLCQRARKSKTIGAAGSGAGFQLEERGWNRPREDDPTNPGKNSVPARDARIPQNMVERRYPVRQPVCRSHAAVPPRRMANAKHEWYFCAAYARRGKPHGSDPPAGDPGIQTIRHRRPGSFYCAVVAG